MKNSSKDLKEAYQAASAIQQAETPRDADMMTGYAIGIIDEKLSAGKLTYKTAQAICDMIYAIGDDVYSQKIWSGHEHEKENGKGSGKPQKRIDFIVGDETAGSR